MRTLSLEEYKRHCEQPLKVPIYTELSSDLVSPIRVFYALKQKHKKGFLLESREHVQDVGRYSFIGFNPKMSIEVKDQKTHLYRNGKKQAVDADFKSVLRKILQQHKIIHNAELPPLAGGAVGFMSYDAVRLFEDIPCKHEDKDQLPDIYFGFYETIIVFDHLYQRMTLIYIPDRKGSEEEQYEKGVTHLKELLHYILSYSQKTLINFENSKATSLDFKTDCDDASFQKIVKKCKEHILAGDVFQVVPSRTFYKEFEKDPLDIFRVLRTLNPSPFMFYLDNDDYVITGSSPERFASLRNGHVETLPIGGTAPRGKGKDDHLFEEKLLSDEKEIAEHMMLVDLARNDMGSICIPDSIQVKDLRSIQRLSHVMHMTTRVIGRIKPEYDAIDVMRAFLPTGTLSGAPKIRAMEIIDDIEKSRRGIYGGCVGYIDNLGNFDSCIAIRMAFIKDGIARVRAGAGIVYDSKPEKETLETLSKAKVVLDAICQAEKGGL